jgi:hypothetical protein
VRQEVAEARADPALRSTTRCRPHLHVDDDAELYPDRRVDPLRPEPLVKSNLGADEEITSVAPRQVIHGHQLRRHEPQRNIVVEPGSNPLGRPECRGQWLDQDDNADRAGPDGVGPECFDETHSGADMQHA